MIRRSGAFSHEGATAKCPPEGCRPPRGRVLSPQAPTRASRDVEVPLAVEEVVAVEAPERAYPRRVVVPQAVDESASAIRRLVIRLAWPSIIENMTTYMTTSPSAMLTQNIA